MSSHSALQLFLRRLLRRSPLSADEQRTVLGLSCDVHQVGARYDIVFPGQSVDYSCLIADGFAGRYDVMRDGQRQITALHIPGDMCDLHSVVAPIAGWGIVALCPTTILRVPHAELREIVHKSPALALAFWRDTTADAAVLAKWIGNLGRKDSRARLAHLFCEIGQRMDYAGLASRTRFPLPATQEQLADILGLTSVHVNRTLQALRIEGVIETRGRMVKVCDWGALTAIADFSTDYLDVGVEKGPSLPLAGSSRPLVSERGP